MVKPDYTLHELQSLRGPERPTLRQHVVVNIFEPYAGGLTEDIERMQHLLQIDQAHIPGPILLFNDSLERGRGGAMPSARVEIDEINICHYCFIAASHPCYTRALKR